MTTIYKDKSGKTIRVDKGTQRPVAAAIKPAAPATPPAAPAADAPAAAAAKPAKEK